MSYLLSCEETDRGFVLRQGLLHRVAAGQEESEVGCWVVGMKSSRYACPEALGFLAKVADSAWTLYNPKIPFHKTQDKASNKTYNKKCRNSAWLLLGMALVGSAAAGLLTLRTSQGYSVESSTIGHMSGLHKAAYKETPQLEVLATLSLQSLSLRG